jgi:hypothetical protein
MAKINLRSDLMEQSAKRKCPKRENVNYGNEVGEDEKSVRSIHKV